MDAEQTTFLNGETKVETTNGTAALKTNEDAPQSNKKPSNFNAADYLEKIGDKPYLNPRKAITWFYSDFPQPLGRIITRPISTEPLIFVAEVWVGDVLVATGHADMEGKCKSLRTVESAAIRRALANAGYGTEQAIKLMVKNIAAQTTVEEKKATLGAGTNRRM